MDEINSRGLTMCSMKAALAAGTTTTISTTGTTLFSIRGKAYSKAVLANVAAPTLDVNTGVAFVGVLANQGSVFVVGFDSAGALKVAQGSVETLDAAGKFIGAPKFPPIPDTVCPFAYLVILADSTASTWTFGASNQASATGITYNRTDVFALPTNPQIA